MKINQVILLLNLGLDLGSIIKNVHSKFFTYET